MKRLILFFIFILFCSPLYATNWCNDATIVTCLPIGTGSGTTLSDESSNSNDGTFKGSGEPAWSVTVPGSGDGFGGTTTQSVEFADLNDYVVFNQADFDDMSAFTVVAWVYIEYGESDQNIAWKGYSGDGWAFAVNGYNALRFKVDHADTDLVRKTADISGNFNGWAHYAVTWDGSTTATNIHIYINGDEPSYDTTTDGVGARVSDASIDFTIGADDTPDNSVQGWVDEYAVFDSVLTEANIEEIMANGLTGESPASSTINIWTNIL